MDPDKLIVNDPANLPRQDEQIIKRVENIQEGPHKQKQYESQTGKDFKRVMDDKKGEARHNVSKENKPKSILDLGDSDDIVDVIDENAIDNGVLPSLFELSNTKKQEMPVAFFQEQSDQSSLPPPPFMNMSAHTSTQSTAPVVPVRASMQALIDQLVSAMQTIKMDGHQDSTIFLKHPPLFAGVAVTVTSFETAHGEFNISFHNLTQAAKVMIDQNQVNLQNFLAERGFIVHIVVTSTQEIEKHAEAASGTFTGQKEQGEGSQDQNQNQNTSDKDNKK